MENIVQTDNAIRTVGRPVARARADYVRDLTVEDLARLDEPRPTAVPEPLKKIRDSHHALARAIATGMRPAEAALVTGYSVARISVLQNSPAFMALVDFYRSNVNEAFAGLLERMAGLAIDVLEELRDRLESAPESLSNQVLLQLFEKLADRTGHGPQSTLRTVNLNITAAELEALKEPINEAERVEVSQIDRRPSLGAPYREPVATNSSAGSGGEGESL